MTQDNQSPEPSEKEKELMEAARETKAELEAKQNEALEAIARDSGIERYDTVTIGELEIEVKAWLPGDVEDTVLKAQSLGESGDPADIKRSMETMFSALSEMTVDSTYNMDFWREFHSKWGHEGLVMAVETILEPASDHMERQREGVDGFRQDK